MTLKDALNICHTPYKLEFGAESVARADAPLPAGRDAAEDPENLCHICGEPFDGDPTFDICADCEDYAASGERDYDLDEGDR